MRFFSFLQDRSPARRRCHLGARHPKSAAVRLQVEQLEDRCCPASYSVVNLGIAGSAAGINTFGQIVGYENTASGYNHAFLWTPTAMGGTSGSVIDLGTLGGTASGAAAVNTAGQVVGQSRTASGQYDAF